MYRGENNRTRSPLLFAWFHKIVRGLISIKFALVFLQVSFYFFKPLVYFQKQDFNRGDFGLKTSINT